MRGNEAERWFGSQKFPCLLEEQAVQAGLAYTLPALHMHVLYCTYKTV